MFPLFARYICARRYKSACERFRSTRSLENMMQPCGVARCLGLGCAIWKFINARLEWPVRLARKIKQISSERKRKEVRKKDKNSLDWRGCFRQSGVSADLAHCDSSAFPNALSLSYCLLFFSCALRSRFLALCILVVSEVTLRPAPSAHQ